MKSAAWVVALMMLLFWSCERPEFEGYSGMGKRPQYMPLTELRNIRNTPPRPIELSGTIFLRDTLFFIMEQRKGIHVFSIRDTLNPQPITFLSIPAISDFTLAGDRLYADSWKDLVTIDISNLTNIRELNRLEGVFSPQLFPPLFNGIFECVDDTKGAVIGWNDAFLENVRCRTIN